MQFWTSLGLLACLTVVCYGQNPFTFEDFLSGQYSPRGYSGQWISDNEVQLQDGDRNVIVTNVVSNETKIILASSVLSTVSADSFSFSPDRQLVLISYDTQSQFRHSTTARFAVYSIESKTYTDVADAAFLQTAHWGPNGRSLLYVLDNDIYYSSDFPSKPISRVTESGVPGVIYNGVPDWVYEEEVLEASTAYWFSPNGQYLLYVEFNDTAVPEMTYMKYGKPGSLEDKYPTKQTIRYPKAGATNPSHTSYIVKLTDSVLRPLPIRSDTAGDTVTYGLQWISNTYFTEQIMLRTQSESSISLCDVDIECKQLSSEKNTRGWIRQRPQIFNASLQSYITIQSKDVGNQETYNHLFLSPTTFLTDGLFDVLSIIGWDQTTGFIYFSATEEGFPARTQVYRVNDNGGVQQCLTCSILTPELNRCTSASARFSSNYTYAIITCSAPDPSVISLYQIGGDSIEFLYDLQDNSDLRAKLETKDLPIPVDYVIPIANGFKARARLLIPQNMKPDTKYPLLVNVYAGPDSNQVLEGFSIGWQTYLTSSLNVIYATIDGRGSGRSSDELLFSNYRQLGTAEIIDQINVTSWFQKNVAAIDSSRSAIWGWSYGGYATGRALELDTEGVFKCGISVAPVTNWMYYDSIYTERYMGLPTPEDNWSAYSSGDLVTNVDNLKNKQYYLIHGNGDDNVHYQQSMLFSRALELKDVIFQQQSYPDENHSLGGVSRHLYHSMDKFWKNCFDLE